MAERGSKDARSGHARLVPRREEPVEQPEPLSDPRLTAAPRRADPRAARAGRNAGLVVACVGLLWVIATWVGGALGWSERVRALFDLFALAGFGFGLYLTWQAWRIGRADKG